MIKGFKKTNRSAYSNYLRAKFDAYTGASTVGSYPSYLCLDPCDLCQLRCPTCPTGIENASRMRGAGDRIVYRQQRGLMTAELFDTLIDELGPFLFLLMFYNWGEPLLNKSLPRFITKAHDLDIETEVHTNLSLPLTDAFIAELMGSGLDYLVASIDGFTQETYQVHRVGGDLSLVKRNLERCAQIRDRLGVETAIAYKMLKFGHNEHEAPDVERYCRDLGIMFLHGDAFIHDAAWLPSHRKSEAPYYTESEMQAFVDRAAAAGATDYFEAHERGPAWVPKVDAAYPRFCSWHYAVSVVTATGPVSPCCATAKQRDDFGKVIPGHSRFGEVWNNERYRHARTVFAGGPPGETAGVETVCDRCHFPKFVQQLYSSHDARIAAQFQRLFSKTEPVLNQAFRLLSQLRYGRLERGTLKSGIIHPLIEGAVGAGDERDMIEFVKFYEANLLDDGAGPPQGAIAS